MSLTTYNCEGMKSEEIKKKIKDAERPILLKFSMDRCPPCKLLKDALAGYKTDLNITIFELNRTMTNDLGDLPEMYEITGFPTVVLVDEDMKQIDRMNGFSNISRFNDLINKHKELFETGGEK